MIGQPPTGVNVLDYSLLLQKHVLVIVVNQVRLTSHHVSGNPGN